MDLTNKIYNDEDAARKHLEAQIWPDGPVCPHCGSTEATPLKGKAHRKGLYQCNDCREQFSVTVGTVFERSKIKLNKWVLAAHLMGASKKGISSKQLERMLGVTYKTAWFMSMRLREAMRDEVPAGGIGGKTRSSKPMKLSSAERRRTFTKASQNRRSMPLLRSLSAMVRCAPNTSQT